MKAPQVTKQDNFFWLLIALVLLLGSGAIVSQTESNQGRLLINISLLVMLASTQKRQRWEFNS